MPDNLELLSSVIGSDDCRLKSVVLGLDWRWTGVIMYTARVHKYVLTQLLSVVTFLNLLIMQVQRCVLMNLRYCKP